MLSSPQSVAAINERLLRYLRRFLADEQARDVIQDAWESLHRSIAAGSVTISPERGPLPWLYRTVRNRAIDMLRRRVRETGMDPLEQVAASAAPPPLTDIRLALEEAAGRYSDDLDGLLLLRSLLDRSIPRSAVADTLGVSERTLRREIAKFLSYLARELRRNGYSPTDLL